MRTWLVVDLQNIVHRAFHSRPLLSHDSKPTGAIAGFFDLVLRARSVLGTEGIVFCCDSRVCKRKDIYLPYKATRKPCEPVLYQQIDRIKKELLPAMGFNNVLEQEGYEADDLVAAVTFARTKSAVIMSSDSDLLQCLSEANPAVARYDPGTKELTTAKDFVDQRGIQPYDWPMIKAIAGDTSDNIPGVEGVAEKGALSYLTKGKIQKWKIDRIEKARELIERNLELIRLPLVGCVAPEIYEDNDTDTRIRLVLSKCGINRR